MLVATLLAGACRNVDVDEVGFVDFTDLILANGEDIKSCGFIDVMLQQRRTNSATVEDIVNFSKRQQMEFEKVWGCWITFAVTDADDGNICSPDEVMAAESYFEMSGRKRGRPAPLPEQLSERTRPCESLPPRRKPRT